MSKKTTVLMILDGYGVENKAEGNAIALAKKPVMDKLTSMYPTVQGEASGLFVGLPDGQMGNSEVGHTNMGAGRIVYQMLVKISKSIKDGDFFENPALVSAMENCKKNGSALHLMVCCLRAVYTAIRSICTALLRWQRETALIRYTFTASLTDVTFRRLPQQSTWKRQLQRLKKSV